MKIRERKPLIIVVEDDEVMAQFNSRLLENGGCDTLIAYTAAQAREMFNSYSPDLVVLDILLPDGDGYELCAELRKKTDAPVVFLTAKTETEDKTKGFETGADYYLTKPFDKDEFLAIVMRLLRKSEQTITKTEEAVLMKKGSLTMNLTERKAYVNGNDVGLSPKEYAVFLLLVQNENKELTYEQLYEAVWGTAMNHDSCALRQQISRIKKKLGEEKSTDFAIFNEHGKGYTFTRM